MSTQTSHHGHELLDMMHTSGKTYSRASLLEDMADHFGQEAVFHICDMQDLSGERLVDILTARGKFVGTPDAFMFNPSTRCGDE